jgi:transposase
MPRQLSVSSSSRRAEDLTPDKTDEKDAVLIARLTAQLRCYEPEPVDETWARLRHLGVRREQLLIATSSQVQQMRDLPDCGQAGRQKPCLRIARRIFAALSNPIGVTATAPARCAARCCSPTGSSPMLDSPMPRHEC